jgi:hypothetical protein
VSFANTLQFVGGHIPMGSNWQDCIVTLIDLIDVKKKAQQGIASQLMVKFHSIVAQERSNLKATAHVYVWNDSVLLLSYVNENNSSFEAAMKDADNLKRRVDELERSYAIAVKGQTFPQVSNAATKAKGPSVTVIRASSWAMANVFEIERVLAKKFKKPWYVDSWIAKRIHTSEKCLKEPMPMLPKKQERSVYLFDGYLYTKGSKSVSRP